MMIPVQRLIENEIDLPIVRLVMFNVFDRKDIKEDSELQPGEALSVQVLDFCGNLGFTRHEMFSILRYYKEELLDYGNLIWEHYHEVECSEPDIGPAPLVILEILDNKWARVYCTMNDMRRSPFDLSWNFKEQEEGRPESLPLLSVAIALTILIGRLASIA